MTEHYSDCAVHNGPALPVGECDCGGFVLEIDAQEAAVPDLDGQCSEGGSE